MSPDDEDENNDDEKDDGNAETDRDDEASFIHPSVGGICFPWTTKLGCFCKES